MSIVSGMVFFLHASIGNRAAFAAENLALRQQLGAFPLKQGPIVTIRYRPH